MPGKNWATKDGGGMACCKSLFLSVYCPGLQSLHTACLMAWQIRGVVYILITLETLLQEIGALQSSG